MTRTIFKIFIWLLGIILFAVLILAGTAYAYRDKVKNIIISKINERVTEPVVIDGGIQFSLLDNFPFGSVTLTDVSVKNKFKGPEYLLKVHELSCLFNMLDIISGKINISRIHILNGEVNICMNEKGDGNFDIFKPSTDTTSAAKSNTSLKISLSKAVVKNIHFTYITADNEENIKLKIEKMTLGGKFGDERFELETNEKLIIELLRINGENYLTEKPFTSSIKINVDQAQNKYTLNKGDIELAGNKFDATGYVVSGKKSVYVNVGATAQSNNIEKLIALIPVKFKSTLEGAQGSGGFEVDARVVGDIRKGVNPDISVTAKLNKARVIIPRIRKPLENVTVDASYHMDSVGGDELIVRKFHSEFDGQPQNFTLKLTHLSDPDFVFNANGVANLRDLKIFLSDSGMQTEGLVVFQDFHIEGNKKVITQPTNPKFKASGKFTMKNVSIKVAGVLYNKMNGTLIYNNRDIMVKGFTVNFLNTDIAFDGEADRVFAYAFSRDRTTHTEDVPLGLNGRLHIKTLDLGKIITAFNTPAPSSASSRKAAQPNSKSINARDILNIKGNLSIEIDKFVYQKMLFERINAGLVFSPYRIDITDLSTHTMGGDITDQGSVTLTADKKMKFNFAMNIDKVDLPVLFRECQNFGQTTLTDKNLKGLVTADLQLKTVWNNYTDIDMAKVEGNLNCHIVQGELNDFGPIRSLATFIKIKELNHIVFSDLSNQITIKNKIISIPMMEIQSSAINLMAAGTHTFDNIMDYQIKVNLRKLLAAKFGRKENDDEYIEGDPYEGVNLYLTIKGSVDHPVIKYDKKAVKKNLKNVLASQKQELKDLFGNKKGKKLKGKDVVEREEKYYNTNKKPEFIDFQEDSSGN
jgi:hypothetical protein